MDKRQEVAGNFRENKVRGARLLRPPVWSMLLQTQRLLSTQEEELRTIRRVQQENVLQAHVLITGTPPLPTHTQ